MSKIVEINAEQLAAKILELSDSGTLNVAFDGMAVDGDLCCWGVFNRYSIWGTDSDCIVFDYAVGGFPHIYDRNYAEEYPQYFYDWVTTIISDCSIAAVGKKCTTVFIEED